ncbi:TPA: transcription termination/antitermination protein NusA [Candidatus Saccharibacteria bacterium]|nr:MAG: Transcription elongation factor NusA [Candidatus Saccharibacteria bacterium GW2011_GWC2_44_17]MBH1956193.1 transcription termination/antitermination protein NusA [Candidatus Saccharibacteria bacterium]MBH1972581.1 transcription termination/antitermination protein NusA [Candidatus Saccharibacteria bacterium]MBH1990783.1 transcription termination/antitermination protein NusA [Candidatus Saccharibacteria bacterium]HBH77538.1 transcription termination/antitermination protein NusA [Candidatu
MEDINIKQLTLAVRTIAEEKNLPEETVLSVIEQAIAAAWRRDNGERDQEVRAELNTNDGTANVFVSREVVEEVGSDAVEISLDDARKLKADAEVGDTVEEKHEVVSFGRVAAQTAKQVVLQRLREAEREVVLEEYEDKIGTIVNGTVQRVEPRVIRVELGKATGIIPQSEQIQGEFYSIGSRIKVFIKDIERDNRGPQLILSRGNEAFVEYLFRQEVPEMETGAVEIKAIAREAGRRTKLAVNSTVPGVDPVGTFVGGHGTRVQAVMNEIGDQEKIDIITFDENNEQFIRNALSPAEVVKVEIDEAAKRARVYVNEDQQSIAIGRGGQNVRLASRLTGYELDIETAEAPKPAEPKAPKKNIEDSLLNAVEDATEE